MTKRTSSSLRAAVVTLVAGFVLPASAEPQGETQTQPATQTQPGTQTEPGTQNETQNETQTQEPLEAASQESLEAPAPSTTAKVLDVLILRPLGLVVVPVGVAAFIPAALLTAPNGMDSVKTALELFVTGPANYVFQRPLGEI